MAEGVDFKVEVSFVCEVATELQAQHEDNVADDAVLKLVDKTAFIHLFTKFCPHAHIAPAVFWDRLFGHHSTGRSEGHNPHVRYLSTQSSEKILQNWVKFTSGVDFQHLPTGFFIAKNPHGGGVCDVLHFSDYIASYQQNVSPLAIELAPNSPSDVSPAHFTGQQEKWYQFLEKKRVAPTGDIYCSKPALQNAFIAFSNTLEQLGLEYYAPKFAACLNDDVNPIVLLGRWEALLTNRHLQSLDVLQQWQVLPELPLVKSSEAIRAMTDYENDECPCGFVLPQMQLTESGFVFSQDEQYRGFRTESDFKLINDECSFWRYIAYQPQRNSITFYRQAIEAINAMTFEYGEIDRYKMYRMLAASTTGDNHTAKTANDNAKELSVWASLCTLIDTIESSTVTMRSFMAMGVSPGNIKSQVIEHLNRLDIQPNILFLDSIARHIADHLKGLNPLHFMGAMAGFSPLQPLETLSNKLNYLIEQHRTHFYHGARFYFQNGRWNTLTVQTYTELQYYMLNKRELATDFTTPKFIALMTPYLSTFNVSTQSEVDVLAATFIQEKAVFSHQALLEFSLEIFNDVETHRGLNSAALYELIRHIQTLPKTDEAYISMVDYLEKQFSDRFAPGYFAEKKQQLIDAYDGLTKAQIKKIKAYRFLEEQEKALIEMESALVRRNRLIGDTELNALNELLVNYRNIIMPADFTLFTQRLASIREQLPPSLAPLKQLIQLLLRKRSLEDFNQIYLRNKIVACRDDDLIQKFIVFIQHVKPLIAETMDPLLIDRVTLQETLATIVLNSAYSSQQGDYVERIRGVLINLNHVILTHIHIQHYLLASFNYIQDKNTPAYFEHVLALTEMMRMLCEILPAGEDERAKENMLMIYSLLANYHQKPVELIKIFQLIHSFAANDQRRFMLNFVSQLLDNKRSVENLDVLMSLFRTHPNAYEQVVTQCQTPPYPDINELIAWIKNDTFTVSYAKYSLKPYGARRSEFAFNRKKYDIQKKCFVGVDKQLFTTTVADDLARQLSHNKQATIEALKAQLEALKVKPQPLSAEDKRALLCVCIELLARTTAQYDDKQPPTLISQELNTTQVMALYAMLMNPGNKLISEIDTGEGKSRIMMVLAACLAAQGKTVDFLTSDMQLAERDYLSYKAFFTVLGIRTSLISLNTQKQLYQRGGVNFSDNNQLILLRNKSDIACEPFAYLSEQEHTRCLLVDEVDKFKHDKSKDAYNYAAKSKKLAGFVWVYPRLVRFMQQQQKLAKRRQPLQPEELVKQFLHYVQCHETNILHKASLAELNKHNPRQLKTWLRSALTALQMKADSHYKLTDADESKLFAVRDSEGHTCYSRKIYVLDGGRPVPGSSFSDGVHQCLCAKENILSGKDEFTILPENDTQRSSYPVTFMAAYHAGSIYGVSGTTRSGGPRASAQINYEKYNYLLVPREKPLLREDKNIWAAKDQKQHIEFIKRALLEKLKLGHPALMICKDDHQSKALHDALAEDKTWMKHVKKLQRVHGLSTSQEENDAIHQAGSQQCVTISTAGMLGRGVDINATNLFVIAAYVPTLEDEKQIKGRTARAGKQGEFRMILNINDPDCPINGTTYNIRNEVEKVQKNRALKAVFQEEISRLYALFLENITRKFLEGYRDFPLLERADLLERWQKFLGRMQKDWDSQRGPLLKLVEAHQSSKKQQVAFVNVFHQFTKTWIDKVPAHTHATATACSLDEAHIQQIYTGLTCQSRFFKPQRQQIDTIQRDYDPADDGQARVYSCLFPKTWATLTGKRRWFADYHAWCEGRGALFPDFAAVLRGERALFANLIATINRWIAEWKAWLATKPVTKPAERHTPSLTPAFAKGG